MIKYKTLRYDITIKEIEIIKESDKTVTLKNEWRREPFRENKHSDYVQYHDTFEIAKQYLKLRTIDSINYHAKELKKYNDELEKINLLK